MIDLHLHTIFSDGSQNPEYILKNAGQLGLRWISITDHDSIGAYEKLNQKGLTDHFSGGIIPGCEFSVVHDKMPLEVLGYGFDLQMIRDSGLISDEWFLERENQYIDRMKAICRNLGIKLTDSLSIQSGKAFATQVIHEDLRKYPDNKKFFSEELWNNVNAFYRTCINNEESPFYLNQTKDYPTIKEVSDLIRKAGGKSFLAHLYGYFIDDYESFLDSLISHGALDGLECYHSLHNMDQTEFLLNYCNKNNLFSSGGSDYHGALKPTVFMGESVKGVQIPDGILEPWLNTLAFPSFPLHI